MCVFIFSLILISLAACTPHYNISRKNLPYPACPNNEKCYLVKKGDSLWKIASFHGVGAQALMFKNRISNPRKLKEGQLIIIPKKTIKNRGEFSWPVEGKIINHYGKKINNVINKGINITSAKNRDIKASADGEVVFSNYLKGWGNTLIIEHSNRFYTVYANMKNISVNQGTSVKRGQPLGKVGTCDRHGRCILHFEIRKGNIAQNPLNYLGSNEKI